MNTKEVEKLQSIFLDWCNNWISTQAFADHYGLSKSDAIHLINITRKSHETLVELKQAD